MKAEEHFNDRADRYESLIRKIIPNATLFFETALGFLPDGKIRILELGSGTGLVTEMILSFNPHAVITCIDMSPEMLEIAFTKTALSGVDFIEGDFREKWPEGMFDVVITTLCFHHLPDADRTEVIRRIYGTLAPGGRFINGDVFKPETRWEEGIFRNRWRRFMAGEGLSEDEATGMIVKREDSYAFLDTMHNYQQKLIDAGFERIICPFIYDFYGIIVAFR